MRSVIIWSDVHTPNEDRPAVEAILRYMADEKWDEFIQLGDFLDFSCISPFNKTQPLLGEGQRLLKDYEHANGLLDVITGVLRHHNKDAKMIMIQGNHELWIRKIISENPALEGLLEHEKHLRFKERGIRYVQAYPKGELYNVGKLYFTHGFYTNEHHAKKHVDSFGVNIAYGHTHSHQVFTKVNLGKGKALQASSLGCLAKLDMPYLKGRPTAWVHGFGVAHVRDDGFFNLYPVIINNGTFTAPNGKVYSYKTRFKPNKQR